MTPLRPPPLLKVVETEGMIHYKSYMMRLRAGPRTPLVALATLFGFLGSACPNTQKLNKSDLDKLCASAQRARAQQDPEPSVATIMIKDLLRRDPSAGMLRMLETDLAEKPDKGAVITSWRRRSGLDEYECPSLEAIYPGATSNSPAEE